MSLISIMNALTFYFLLILFQGSLVCYQRFQKETVSGCSGKGLYQEYYCAYPPANYLFYVGSDMGPGALGLCKDNCDDDTDCMGDLFFE